MFGYGSIDPSNLTARASYIRHMGILAQYLPETEFIAETGCVIRSISTIPVLVREFSRVFPELVSTIETEQKYKLAYMAGCRFYNERSKENMEFMDLVESMLNEWNDIEYEVKTWIEPRIPSPSEHKFVLWRLCRLKQVTIVESVLYRAFTNPMAVPRVSAFLPMMPEEMANKFLIYALTNQAQESRIHAIEYVIHHSASVDQSIRSLIASETSVMVLEKVSELPVEMLDDELLEKLVESGIATGNVIEASIGNKELFNKLCKICVETGIELNSVAKCGRVSYEVLASVLPLSREIITQETLDSIDYTDSKNIVYKVIMPRANENTRWRVRMNALLILKHMILNKMIEDMDSALCFLTCMAFDPVYTVREEAMSTLLLVDPQVSSSIIESLFAISPPKEDSHRMVIRQLLRVLSPVLPSILSQERIEAIRRDVEQ